MPASAAALLSVGLLLLAAFPQAFAQTSPMTCVPPAGAPSFSRPSFTDNAITAYYAHDCNYVPSGVSGMQELLHLDRIDDCTSLQGVGFLFDAREHRQANVQFSKRVDQGYSANQCYRPYETLTISGSFSYGSVSGCGRISSSQVRCQWFGQLKQI